LGILTIITIAVKERTAEIGLLRPMGATQRQILLLFMGEAIALWAIGGFAGLVLGASGAFLPGVLVPALPTHTPISYDLAVELLSALIGLSAGVLPASRAALLDPIETLRAE